MSLTTYKEAFDNAYQEVFDKTLVGKNIANLRFKPILTYGESVERVIYDTSAVRVRTVTRGAASTIDKLSDTSELLQVNVDKEAVFSISDGEVKQAGPLNPGEVIGAQIGHKVSQDLDARILYETVNALYNFDQGDLTGLNSNSSPFELNSNTVPQMVTRMPAKLRAKNNIPLTNLCLVVDSYAAADIAQYLLGKQFDVVNAVFKNGYAEGQVAGGEVYISENLTGEVIWSQSSLLNGQSLSIGGVVFWAGDSPENETTYGGFWVGANGTDGLQYLADLINNPGDSVAGRRIALSEDDIVTVTDVLRLTATASGGSLTVLGTGSGRLATTDAADGRWTRNKIHCYYGKKGGIDVVVQDLKEVEMRPESDRRATNVFSSYLAGIKTFADGAKKFLDVEIQVEDYA